MGTQSSSQANKDPLALTDEVLSAAMVLWDYHQLKHSLQPADGIVVFGSNDIRVAHHAAELFHAGYAPWLSFSGAQGRMTEHWDETEAEVLSATAIAAGVPSDRVMTEHRATNTGENIRFTRELLAAKGIPVESLIAVQKPYMERRTYAALQAQWPSVRFQVSSPARDLTAYCNEIFSATSVIAAIVGDFQRILEYPALGYATEQPVPAAVRAAFELLVGAGFTSELIP